MKMEIEIERAVIGAVGSDVGTTLAATMPTAPINPGAPSTEVVAQQPRAPPTADDPLSVVGLVLLAYGLVQLLSKVLDRLPLGRAAAVERSVDPRTGFTEEDRKRLEWACEQLEVQRRLVGQALDGSREANQKLENVLRKLRAVWKRIGRRQGDDRG